MAAVTDVIEVTATLEDTTISAKAFGESLILTDETPLKTISTRTKQYSSSTEVATDWGTTSKVYKACAAHFSQTGHNETIKVGLKLSSDASITVALNSIYTEDPDWFQLHSVFNTKAEILEIAAWAATYNEDINYGASTEDEEVIDSSDTTDIISAAAALGYNNTFICYTHQSGVDAEDVSITVASGVATVTSTGHGLRVDDNITVSGAAGSGLNGNFTVVSAPTTDTFTYATTESDGADANNGAIDYFARYEFIDVGYSGRQLGKDIGTTSWDGKTLTGFNATPLTLMTDTQANTVLDKGGNVYITRKGATYMAKGQMVSGRFIENQNVLQWITARVLEECMQVYIGTEKVAYTNADFEKYATAIKTPLNTQIQRTGLNPYSDEQNFVVTFPNSSDISSANKIAGIVPDVTVLCRIGQAVHKITIDITAIV